MKIYSNYSLKNHNTFGIDATAAAFVDVHSTADVKAVLKENTLPIYVLGGGSNILFTKDYYPFLFIKNEILGIKIVENAVYMARTRHQAESMTEGSSELVFVEIGGGVAWHDLVLWAIDNDLGGIENLSLIPGTVGAAPIQNIGAYGVELKNVFHSLEAFNLQTFDIQIFTNEDCQFGYRESIFKNTLKGQYLITKVVLTLRTPQYHTLKMDYGDIQKTLAQRQISSPTIADISKAVMDIRESKLPNPKIIGNAGSFFKNPEIPLAQFNELTLKFPEIVGYPTAKNTVKVAAGWLIEAAGWKGKRVGNIGVHDRQALVLVNYGGGKGLEIKVLAEMIQASILERFGIFLMAEVNWL